MALLLDTHVVLWWLVDDPGLADDVKESLDHEPDIYVSAATVWEVAIKQALGKLVGPDDLPNACVTADFNPFPSPIDTLSSRPAFPYTTVILSTGYW